MSRIPSLKLITGGVLSTAAVSLFAFAGAANVGATWLVSADACKLPASEKTAITATAGQKVTAPLSPQSTGGASDKIQSISLTVGQTAGVVSAVSKKGNAFNVDLTAAKAGVYHLTADVTMGVVTMLPAKKTPEKKPDANAASAEASAATRMAALTRPGASREEKCTVALTLTVK